MRRWLVLMATALLLVGVGCSHEVAGTAQPDPNVPSTAVTDDGYGIIVGYSDAPAQIELFTEPQCPHCADLQADFGRDMASYINLGQLAVTYRPLTFLDSGTSDYSARVSNALFLAAGPETPGTAFQAFVEELWGNQDPTGSGPTDAEIADMATESGIPAAAVDKIAAGDEALDVQNMNDLNYEFLSEIDLLDVGTPKVYDLNNDEVLDIYDNDWLSKLLSTV